MMLGSHREAHDRSLTDPEAFWGEAAAAITWDHEPTVALDTADASFYRCCPDDALDQLSYPQSKVAR
jgi:propionyl-CoA synthetase